MFRENCLIADVNEYQKHTPHKASMYDKYAYRDAVNQERVLRRTERNANKLYNLTSQIKKSQMTNKPADRCEDLLASEGLEDIVATTLLQGRPKTKSISYHNRFDSFVKER